jgi:hypothetical protein
VKRCLTTIEVQVPNYFYKAQRAVDTIQLYVLNRECGNPVPLSASLSLTQNAAAGSWISATTIKIVLGGQSRANHRGIIKLGHQI